jgi:hypothetical protein
MTHGVSQWIWPLELPSHTLHPSVQRACHALSLDDERTTFHPVLWDEKNETKQTANPRFTSGERISQVWFAGVHANVGGGYPDDSLAQIPLYWIMQEAKACGLVFKAADPDAVAETKEAQDKDGRLYDSRGGLGSYYRYGPRRLSGLCNELFSRTLNDSVSIATPKIHESVFRRIKNNAHVYAPIGIPHEYEVVVTVPKANSVDADFRIDPLPVAPSPDTFELQKDAEVRVLGERSAVWPLVYARAALYFLTLLMTFVFFVFPFTDRSNVLLEKQNVLSSVSNLIRDFGEFLPKLASGWFEGYAQHPLAFLILAGVLAIRELAYCRSNYRQDDGAVARISVSCETGPDESSAKNLNGKGEILPGNTVQLEGLYGSRVVRDRDHICGSRAGKSFDVYCLDEAGLVCAASDKLRNSPKRVYCSRSMSPIRVLPLDMRSSG